MGEHTQAGDSWLTQACLFLWLTQAGDSWLTQAGLFLWLTQACKNINHDLLSQVSTCIIEKVSNKGSSELHTTIFLRNSKKTVGTCNKWISV